MLNILIPISGKGQRFKDVGYKESKPFIKIDGIPMIYRVIKNIIGNSHTCGALRFIFVAAEEDKQDCEMLSFVLASEHKLRNTFIYVDRNTQKGQAYSCLAAKNKIDDSNPLLIINCDQLVLDDNENGIMNSLHFFMKKECDGGILCFWADNPKWSYARISNSKITEVVEKQVISNYATVGAYYFRRGSDFIKSAEDMINREIKVNGEYYVSPTYNTMIYEGKTILPYFVNEMVGLGLPSDLEYYLKNSN